MSARNAYRAAGQAVAAIHEGAEISRVSIDGIEFAGEDRPGPLRRPDALTQIAIGFAGIAAAGRYSFGTAPPGGGPMVDWAFTPSQVDDFNIARSFIDDIDPGDETDILYQAWLQALDLVADEANWDAIEYFASLIEHCPLDGVAVRFDVFP
jgi:hypothetical protein